MEPSGVDLSTISPASSRVRGWAFSLGAVLAAALVACSPAAPQTDAPARTAAASPGASASPGAAATTEPTGEAPALFHIVGGAPVIPRTIVPDRSAILPGAVTVDGDTYHAWVVAFTETPGTQDVHHLTSADAVTWTLQLDDSLAGLSDGLGDPGALPTSVLQIGDEWVVYLAGALETEREGWEVWRATAPGLDGPWTRDEEPVLRRGPAGAWDAGALDFPSVIALDEGYAMIYSAVPSDQRETGSIGRATSTDGIEWTKDDDPDTTDVAFAESDPVATPGLCGGFDERAILQPRVILSNAAFLMAYAGYSGETTARPQVGMARSGDGTAWGCQWPAPALDTSGLAGDGVHSIAAFQLGPSPALLVEWLADGGTDVYLAELGRGGS